MRGQGYFSNSTLATGDEAYVTDYILDALKSFVVISDSPRRAMLEKNIDRYFNVLKTQIETDDLNIKKLIAEKNLDLSFWVQQDNLKRRRQ